MDGKDSDYFRKFGKTPANLGLKSEKLKQKRMYNGQDFKIGSNKRIFFDKR